MTHEGRFWVCENHEQPRAISDPDTGKPADSLGKVVADLPHPLALLLNEYLLEPHPYVKLHRLCDTAEMLTRFLAATALAELRSTAPASPSWPEALRAAVDPGVERPTFGNWVAILREAVAAVPATAKPVVPELAELARLVLRRVDARGPDARKQAILPLRNALSHDGRWSAAAAHEMLEEHGHRERFESLWFADEAAVLRELELIGVDESGAGWILRGAPMRHQACASMDRTRLHERWEPGSILLSRDGEQRYLSLAPLQTYGPVLHRRDGTLERETHEPVVHVYSRRPDWLPEYTVFHERFLYGVGSAAMAEAFERLFPLQEWRESRREADSSRKELSELRREAAAYTFRDIVLRFEEEPFVGREIDLRAAVEWLDRHPEGKGLLLGTPGMGKTAFATRLSTQLARERPKWLRLHHFFKVDDTRCSPMQFMRGVLARLAVHSGEVIELPLDDQQAAILFLDALDRYARSHLGGGGPHDRLVLIVDGLDELVGRGHVLFDIITRADIPHIAWFCLSRPEHSVLDALPAEVIERLFPDSALPNAAGLAPLETQAVRSYLLEELDRRRYDLLSVEDDAGSSPFIDALADRARSLPLYLRLLIEDLRQCRFRIDQPEQLPSSLDAYYHDLIDRLTLDAARTVLPSIVALLALAEAPLSDSLLCRLLADHHLSGTTDWNAILDRALRLGHTLMRRRWLWGDRSGYTLYHETFRNYLRDREKLSYTDFRMAPELEAARARFVNLCICWPDLPAGADEAQYAWRFGARHLAAAQRWLELDGLLEHPSWKLLRRWTEQGEVRDGIDCLPGLINYHDGRPNGRGRAALLATQLARMLTHTGDRARSREWLRFAVDRADDDSTDLVWVIGTHELGSLEFYDGDLAAAMRHYELALERARAAVPPMPGEVAANLLAIATIQLLNHRSVAAIELALEAHGLAVIGQDIAHLIAAKRLVASAHKESCDYPKAAEWLENALVLSRFGGLPAEEAASILSIAWLRYHVAVPDGEGILEEAAAYCLSALDKANACSRFLLVAAAHVCKATIALARWRPGEAEDSLRWLERIPESRIPYDLRVDRLLLKAKVLHASAKLQEAEDAYRRADIAAASSRMPARRADAQVGLGAVSFWQNQHGLAATRWRDALATAHSTSPHRDRLVQLSIQAARATRNRPPF